MNVFFDSDFTVYRDPYRVIVSPLFSYLKVIQKDQDPDRHTETYLVSTKDLIEVDILPLPRSEYSFPTSDLIHVIKPAQATGYGH